MGLSVVTTHTTHSFFTVLCVALFDATNKRNKQKNTRDQKTRKIPVTLTPFLFYSTSSLVRPIKKTFSTASLLSHIYRHHTKRQKHSYKPNSNSPSSKTTPPFILTWIIMIK